MREPHLRGYGSQNGYEDGFYSMLDSVRRSRLVLPTLKDEASGADSTWKRHGRPLVRRMSAKPAPWTLETSIWAGRAAWADSKTFWDTDEVMERRFANDWQILLAYGVRKLVLRFDDGESGSSGDDSADEVEDVRQVLWENDRMVQRIFTLYASACGVIQWITLNAWSEFMDDFRLVSKGSKAMKRSDCDRTFLAVNARGAFVRQRQDKSVAWAATGHDNNKRALNQVEFMLALIHLACNRYIESGELHDVSQALRKLLVHDISPRLTKLFGTLPKRDFRDRFCYVEPVANTLRVHESALRTIFTAIAMGGNGKEAGLLSVERWLAFLRATGQIGVDLSERHALSSFAMSRMCVIDPTHGKGWLRDNSLPFEGFLEALCRLAVLKALPTDEEINAAPSDVTDAGRYMRYLELKHHGNYQEMLKARRRAWGSTPTQPMERCIAHLIAIIMRAVESSCVDEQSPGKDELKLTDAQMERWCKSSGFAA